MKTLLLTLAAWALATAVSYGQGGEANKIVHATSCPKDVSASALAAMMESVPIENDRGHRVGEMPLKCLMVIVWITNKSETRKIYYLGARTDRHVHGAIATDELGNSYRVVDFTTGDVLVEGQRGGVDLYPGKKVQDVYVLEPLVDAAKKITFTLHGVLGSEGDVVFDLGRPPAEAEIKEKAEKEKRQEAKRKSDAAWKADAEREAAAAKREAAIEAAKWRTWTDSTGEHKTEAKFSGLIAGTVKLVRKDGSSVQVPLEKLSDEDKEWITNQADSTKAESDTAPAATAPKAVMSADEIQAILQQGLPKRVPTPHQSKGVHHKPPPQNRIWTVAELEAKFGVPEEKNESDGGVALHWTWIRDDGKTTATFLVKGHGRIDDPKTLRLQISHVEINRAK